jgi:hypothetical protein
MSKWWSVSQTLDWAGNSFLIKLRCTSILKSGLSIGDRCFITGRRLRRNMWSELFSILVRPPILFNSSWYCSSIISAAVFNFFFMWQCCFQLKVLRGVCSTSGDSKCISVWAKLLLTNAVFGIFWWNCSWASRCELFDIPICRPAFQGRFQKYIMSMNGHLISIFVSLHDFLFVNFLFSLKQCHCICSPPLQRK